MKNVKNNSLQGFTIFFKTEKGCKEVYLAPNETVVVPDHYVSDQVRTLAKRRLFKITNA